MILKRNSTKIGIKITIERNLSEWYVNFDYYAFCYKYFRVFCLRKMLYSYIREFLFISSGYFYYSDIKAKNNSQYSKVKYLCY